MLVDADVELELLDKVWVVVDGSVVVVDGSVTLQKTMKRNQC